GPRLPRGPGGRPQRGRTLRSFARRRACNRVRSVGRARGGRRRPWLHPRGTGRPGRGRPHRHRPAGRAGRVEREPARPIVDTGIWNAGALGGTARMIRVLLADDHALVRAGLTKLLEGAADLSVVGVAAD